MNPKTFSLMRCLLSCLILVTAAGSVYAQLRASIQGTVTDSTGALVPGVKITLTDAETGKSQETQSSDEGFYRIAGLAPGKYALVAEKQGYKKSNLENVSV